MNKQTVGKFNQNASLKKSIVAFLLAAALLVSMVGMASATMTWFLEDNSSSKPTGADYWMRKGTGSGTGDVILDGVSKVWAANASATIDVNFGTEPWEVAIDLTNCGDGGFLDAGETITVRIGSLNSTSGAFTENMNFTVAGSGSGCGGTSGIYRETLTPVSAFQVPNGHYLALKLEMGSGQKVTVDSVTTHSWIKCKTADCPDYPVPELSTLVLLSFGLLALFGYVVYRRRNNKSE